MPTLSLSGVVGGLLVLGSLLLMHGAAQLAAEMLLYGELADEVAGHGGIGEEGAELAAAMMAAYFSARPLPACRLQPLQI